MSQPLSIPLDARVQREPSATLQINQRVKALWAQGKTVYHFGFGESRFPVHPKLRTALRENVHRKGYLPVQGLAALREAIAAYYSRRLAGEFTAEQVIVAPGSKSLLFGLLRSFRFVFQQALWTWKQMSGLNIWGRFMSFDVYWYIDYQMVYKKGTEHT